MKQILLNIAEIASITLPLFIGIAITHLVVPAGEYWIYGLCLAAAICSCVVFNQKNKK